MLGGIFDSPIVYVFDSDNGIDTIGNWQVIDQLNGLTATNTTANGIEIKTSSSSYSWCYGHTRNEVPISIKSYKFVYIHFKRIDYNSVTGATGNKIRIYVNPDLSNDDYDRIHTDTSIEIGDTNFFNGTYASGTLQEFTSDYTDYTVEMDISKYTGTFRIITTIAPANSEMIIDKIYLSRYKLT